VQVAVVGDGRSRTAELTRALDQIADADGSVQKGILGMAMEVYEVSHWQLPVLSA
jgi:hypothetical protein